MTLKTLLHLGAQLVEVIIIYENRDENSCPLEGEGVIICVALGR